MIQFAIDERCRLTIARFVGPFTRESLLAHAQMLWKQPDWDPQHRAVVDLTACELNMGVQEIGSLFAEMTADPRSIRRCVLLVDGPTETAVAYLFQSHACIDTTIEICSDRSQVFRSLGAPEDPDRYQWRRIEL